METKQSKWEELSWYYVSAVTTAIKVKSHEMKRPLISSFVQIGPMKNGIHEQHFPENAVITSAKKKKKGICWSLSLVEIFTLATFRLLCIAGENTKPKAVDSVEK